MSAGWKKQSRFPKTRWSLVGRAGASDDLDRGRALDDLLQLYAPAMDAFLVRTLGIPSDLADDIFQGFVTDKILERRILERADRNRGKFRSFLAKSLSRYASTALTKVRKEGNRAVDVAHDPLATARYQDTEHFDQEWVALVVQDALGLMEQECSEGGRMDVWTVFRLRAVDPILGGVEPQPYEHVVAELGLSSPRQAINLLVTAKRCFYRNLQAAVGRYAVDGENVDREIADLRDIVQR